MISTRFARSFWGAARCHTVATPDFHTRSTFTPGVTHTSQNEADSPIFYFAGSLKGRRLAFGASFTIMPNTIELLEFRSSHGAVVSGRL